MSPPPVDLSRSYRGQRVLVTGHTGFKGSWLVASLDALGASVSGIALPPPVDQPSLFTLMELDRRCRHNQYGDIRALDDLRRLLRAARPQVIFHLAAQPLVRRSYDIPLETFDVNVRGTATLLEAVRLERLPVALVIVTSDKCYQNREWSYAYREDDSLGGNDPYAASKAAAELVVESYRRSFFAPERMNEHGVAMATARAGNVIGGGDWGHERLVPMMVDALAAEQAVELRAPEAIRPWQHVLEPVAGYIELGARLSTGDATARRSFSGAWNLGPSPGDTCTVRRLVELSIRAWGGGSWRAAEPSSEKHEATTLRLATDKALTHMAWRPTWNIETAVESTMAWYRAYHLGTRGAALATLTAGQIAAFAAASRRNHGPIAEEPANDAQRTQGHTYAHATTRLAS